MEGRQEPPVLQPFLGRRRVELRREAAEGRRVREIEGLGLGGVGRRGDGRTRVAIARGVATEPGERPEGDCLDAVLDAAAGLTRVEAENAFSLSLVRHGRLSPDVLWDLKGQSLKKAGLLTLHRGGESFADLGGLDALKSFCSRALRAGRPEGSGPRGCSCSGRRARARAPWRRRWGWRRAGRR